MWTMEPSLCSFLLQLEDFRLAVAQISQGHFRPFGGITVKKPLLGDRQKSDCVMKRPKRGCLLKKQFFDLVLPPMHLLLEGSAAV